MELLIFIILHFVLLYFLFREGQRDGIKKALEYFSECSEEDFKEILELREDK